ncbi:MAG: hypothetical protein ACREQV_13515, partial [Candidatus Binatia bacterium]
LRLSGFPDQIVPLADGKVVIGLLDDIPPFTVMDRNGDVVGNLQFPWRGFQDLPELSRQGYMAVAPNGRQWVFAFAFGNGWVTFDRTNSRERRGMYVEHTEFPHVIQAKAGHSRLGNTTVSAYDVSLADSSLYVLFKGTTDEAQRWVDLYSLSSAKYLGSLLFDHPLELIAAASDGLWIIQETPFPHLIHLVEHTGH